MNWFLFIIWHCSVIPEVSSKKQASKQTPFKIIIHGAMGTTRCHSSVHCTAHVQARRSRSWDGKWSTINHRPRTKVRPARLRSACSWRSEAEGKSVWCTIHRNAVPENNKQQLKMWSSKCHSPPQHSNLILSSAASPFPLWTSTVRSLWWSPRSVCFCSHVRRQSLTRMCSEINVVPSPEEPFEARRIWTVPPHRSCSRADSHGGHIQAPHLFPPRPGMSLGTSERQCVGFCQETRPAALYLSVQWCLTGFNTMTTFVIPALVWSRRLLLPHHADGRLSRDQSPSTKGL